MTMAMRQFLYLELWVTGYEVGCFVFGSVDDYSYETAFVFRTVGDYSYKTDKFVLYLKVGDHGHRTD